MDYNVLELGNLIRYNGKLQDYQDQIGLIESIDGEGENKSYSIIIRNWKRETNTITAKEQEIQFITLEEEHLLKLNFIRMEQGYFRYKMTNFIRPIFVYM